MLHDPLTGLPGHALLLDRLEQALIRARTRGTLVLVTGPDDVLDAAKVLRAGLRPDFHGRGTAAPEDVLATARTPPTRH